MAKSLKDFSSLLLTDQCYDKYFLDFNFLDVPCFKSTLSKSLGLSIICGSILVKLPQILKIFNNKSGQGISIAGVCLELFAITATLSYSFVKGFPFSSWGESIFIAIQTSVIAGLVLFYGNRKTQAFVFVIAYFLVTGFLMSGIVPIEILWAFQTATVPVILSAKMVQARANYINQSTGQLSAVTCFLLFFGAIARIFTSVQETGDSIIILTFSVAAVANAVLVVQLLWYWNVKDKDSKKKKA